MKYVLIYLLKQFVVLIIPFAIGISFANLISNAEINPDFDWIFHNAIVLSVFFTGIKYFNYRSHGLIFDQSDINIFIIPEYQKSIICEFDSRTVLSRIQNDYRFWKSEITLKSNLIHIDFKEDFFKEEVIEIKFQNPNVWSTNYTIKSKSRYWWFLEDFGQNKCNVNYLEKLIEA